MGCSGVHMVRLWGERPDAPASIRLLNGADRMRGQAAVKDVPEAWRLPRGLGS